MSDLHYGELTAEEVIKTPFKYGEANTDDANQIKALDCVIEWATKKSLQLVSMNIVKPELSKEDHEFIHVNVIYVKKLQQNRNAY